MIDLVVADEHSQLYDIWIDREYRDIALCHVDFHCDMRGLLIDRQKGKARYVWQCDPFMSGVDSGSFLAHAIMNRIVSKLRWIHDDWGGRQYDDLYCVKYESDFSSLPFRLASSNKWVPLLYEELTFNDWGGSTQDEHLSIDWDGIAHIDYDRNRICRIMTEFLGREFRPKSIFVCRSPIYSHPDNSLFTEFITALETKFKTQAQYLPAKDQPPRQASSLWRGYHGLEHRILLLMRKRGIF